MTRRNTDHAVFDMREQTFHCRHCGESYKPAMPAPLGMFAAMAIEFTRAHRDCKPPKLKDGAT
jgi:hypothetical protein